MSDIALKIENVSKEYRLGAIGGTTLREEVNRWFEKRKMRKHPELYPNETKLGEKFKALNNVSLEIKKGEAIGIIGHNGAGKSTLLKLLSRVTGPSEGIIRYNGRISSMLEVGTGFHGELTGRENVYMNGAILGMSKAEVDAKIEQIIDFSEVRQFIDTPVKRYSSGMYVKLAFSVAAHLDSEIMIMDEVLAVGDVAFQNKCLKKMREAAHTEGRTVLYVSHNMNTIRQLCDRCIVLDKGKVIFDGGVDKAIEIYLFNYLGETSTVMDLRDKVRPAVATGKTKMLHISYVDKEEPLYEKGEAFKFALKWRSNEQLKEVRLQITFRYQDDTFVGTVFSPPICDADERKDYTSTLAFDTSMLTEGKYFCSIVMYQCDELGNILTLDHITRACSFEISRKHQSGKPMRWDHRWNGSVLFPDLEIIKVEA